MTEGLVAILLSLFIFFLVFTVVFAAIIEGLQILNQLESQYFSSFNSVVLRSQEFHFIIKLFKFLIYLLLGSVIGIVALPINLVRNINQLIKLKKFIQSVLKEN